MTPDEEQTYRSLAVAFCDIAVNGSQGRLREDPIVQAITEGHGGSSCGFLLHFVLYQIGIREKWINRSEAKGDGNPGYRVGQNLSLLFGHTWGGPGPKAAQKLDQGRLWRSGDLLICRHPKRENSDHVFVAARDFNGDVSLSYDGGQVGSGGKAEDFRFVSRDAHMVSGHWYLGEREVWGLIPLDRVIEEAEANGKLVDPAEPSVWLASVLGTGEA